MPTGVYKRNFIIKKGDKYGRLTAIRFDHRDKWNKQHWLFKCSCKKEKVICVNNVKNGNTKSCGCLENKGNTTHGMRESKIYHIWKMMKQRCSNPNNKSYKNYGGRGIKVCKRWENSFENFYEDIGEVPKGMSLDRIDNNKEYSKENCRWATRKEQANNMRSNVLLTYRGKTQTIAQWANETGIKYYLLYNRITRYKWSVEKALNKLYK